MLRIFQQTVIGRTSGEKEQRTVHPWRKSGSAFEIHMERGGTHGCDLDAWLQAERELREKHNKNNNVDPRKERDGYQAVVLAIPLSMVVRHLATKALAKISTRWVPSFRGILQRTRPKGK